MAKRIGATTQELVITTAENILQSRGQITRAHLVGTVAKRTGIDEDSVRKILDAAMTEIAREDPCTGFLSPK